LYRIKIARGISYAEAASFFLGVAFFFGAAFLGAALAAGFAGPLVTRPDLVLVRTVGFSTIAGACAGSLRGFLAFAFGFAAAFFAAGFSAAVALGFVAAFFGAGFFAVSFLAVSFLAAGFYHQTLAANTENITSRVPWWWSLWRQAPSLQA
jgi:hypothetical protein